MEFEQLPQKLQTLDPYARAIGYTVINFNALEYHLATLVALVCKVENLESIDSFRATLSFKQKIDILCDVGSKADEIAPMRDDFRVFLSRCEEVNKKRNNIIHNETWYTISADSVSHKKRSLRNKNTQVRDITMTHNQIWDTAREIGDLVDASFVFIDAVAAQYTDQKNQGE